MPEATGVGEDTWTLDSGWWIPAVGWRCTRWSISRGRSLNPQLHPRTLAFEPIQRTYSYSGLLRRLDKAEYKEEAVVTFLKFIWNFSVDGFC